MASRLNPYLRFDDQARAALEFYREVFGGTLILNTFGEFGMADSPVANNIMHGQLETPDGFTLMASDTPPGMAERRVGNDITICLNGDDEASLSGYFTKLAEGGTVSVPLEKQMWGALYGAVTDRFGINWMANISTS